MCIRDSTSGHTLIAYVKGDVPLRELLLVPLVAVLKPILVNDMFLFPHGVTPPFPVVGHHEPLLGPLPGEGVSTGVTGAELRRVVPLVLAGIGEAPKPDALFSSSVSSLTFFRASSQ